MWTLAPADSTANAGSARLEQLGRGSSAAHEIQESEPTDFIQKAHAPNPALTWILSRIE